MTCDIVYRSDPSLVTHGQQVRLLQTKTPGASGDEEEEISPPEDLEVEEEEEEEDNEEEEYEEDNSSNYEPNVRSNKKYEFISIFGPFLRRSQLPNLMCQEMKLSQNPTPVQNARKLSLKSLSSIDI